MQRRVWRNPLRPAVAHLPLHADREAHHMFVGRPASAAPSSAPASNASRRHRRSERHRQSARARRHRTCRRCRRSSICTTRCRSIFRLRGLDYAANCFTAGIKRPLPGDQDRPITGSSIRPIPVLKFVDGEIKRVDEPALTAINMRLRDDYTADCQRGLDRWNKIIDKTASPQFELPHVASTPDREFKDVHVSPAGRSSTRRPGTGEGHCCRSKDDGDFIAV